MDSVVRKFRTTAAEGLVYFDFAEVQAMRHNPMYMSDYVEHLDRILQSTGEHLLTPVETAYLETIKSLSRIAKKKPKKDMGE